MPRTGATFRAIVLAAACGWAGAQEPAPPPVVFDGFGLGDFSAAAAVDRALRAADRDDARRDGVPVDVVASGPGSGGPATAPLAAEVRSRIEGIAVAAGLQGDATQLGERSPRWTGRIGVGGIGPDGGESLELRTRLESRAGTNRLGVEIGPRLERRLGRGVRLFVDGAATAEAVRSTGMADRLPGTSLADSIDALGVSARTGIIR